jgi:hypothetical protein
MLPLDHHLHVAQAERADVCILGDDKDAMGVSLEEKVRYFNLRNVYVVLQTTTAASATFDITVRTAHTSRSQTTGQMFSVGGFLHRFDPNYKVQYDTFIRSYAGSISNHGRSGPHALLSWNAASLIDGTTGASSQCLNCLYSVYSLVGNFSGAPIPDPEHCVGAGYNFTFHGQTSALTKNVALPHKGVHTFVLLVHLKAESHTSGEVTEMYAPLVTQLFEANGFRCDLDSVKCYQLDPSSCYIVLIVFMFQDCTSGNCDDGFCASDGMGAGAAFGIALLVIVCLGGAGFVGYKKVVKKQDISSICGNAYEQMGAMVSTTAKGPFDGWIVEFEDIETDSESSAEVTFFNLSVTAPKHGTWHLRKRCCR